MEDEQSAETPTVSVIIPSMNRCGQLQLTIESIICTTANLEIIVSDGGSHDGTTEYLTRLGNRVIWISGRDSGVYDAINKGVALARGTWLYVIGAGDTVRSEFLSAVKQLLNANFIYYADVLQSSNSRRYGGEFTVVKLIHKNIPHQGMFIPRKYILRSPYDGKYKIYADYAKNIELFGKYRSFFVYIDLTVCNYDNQTGLSNTAVDSVFERDKEKLIKENLGYFWSVFYIVYKTLYRIFLGKLFRMARTLRDAITPVGRNER